MPKELQNLLFAKLELQALPKSIKVKMQIKKQVFTYFLKEYLTKSFWSIIS